MFDPTPFRRFMYGVPETKWFSEAFGQCLEVNASLTGEDLYSIFLAYFPNTDPVALTIICDWRPPRAGLPRIGDDRLNLLLDHELKRAGYL